MEKKTKHTLIDWNYNRTKRTNAIRLNSNHKQIRPGELHVGPMTRETLVPNLTHGCEGCCQNGGQPNLTFKSLWEKTIPKYITVLCSPQEQGEWSNDATSTPLDEKHVPLETIEN